MFLDALDLGKISVGPPYFDSVFLPLMMPAIFLMGIGPLAQWKQASLPALASGLRWAFGVSLVTAVALPWLMGTWTPLLSLGLLLAFWILTTSVVDLRERLAPWRRWWRYWGPHSHAASCLLGHALGPLRHCGIYCGRDDGERL